MALFSLAGFFAPGTRQLNCWPNGYTTRFCSLDDTAAYVKRTYRGIDYFAAFPAPQMDAAIALSRILCEQFGIPKQIPPADKREMLDWSYYERYQGVASHQNFHPQKTDVGPAFDWPRLAAALSDSSK